MGGPRFSWKDGLRGNVHMHNSNCEYVDDGVRHDIFVWFLSSFGLLSSSLLAYHLERVSMPYMIRLG